MAERVKVNVNDSQEKVSIFVQSGISQSGVQTVTGDGVGGTATNVVMTFPTPEEIGALEKVYSEPYATTAVMIADQANQDDQTILVVTDASDDSNITFPSGETRLQAYYTYLGTTNGTMADYELIGAPYGTALAPKVTPDTGTTIDLGWIFGNECNMLSANSNSAFTLTNIKPGGEATVLINRATEPTVTGATKISGHTFQASTNMHLKVKCRQTGIVQYYFLKLT